MYFEKLLSLENDDWLWSFSLDDEIPLWLNIRVAVFWDLQKEEFSLSDPHLKEDKKALEIVRYILISLLKNPCRIKKNKIVIFGAGINNVRENGQYINKLYDLYIENDKRFQLIESSAKNKYLRPRKYNNVFYSDIFLILAKIFSYFTVLKAKDYKRIMLMVDYMVNKKLIKDDDKKLWRKRIMNICKKNIVLNILYRRFLMVKNIKALIIEDAHYGGNSVLIKLAKEHNIPVIEMQHGYIGQGHLAYNYNREQYELLKKYLPDAFLTFGGYWASRIRTPAKILNIGNAYLESKALVEISNEKDILLIISGGTMPELYVELSKLLSSIYKNKYKLLFRPHPSERPNLKERYSIISEYGFEIDISNLYETLPKVKLIISYELSTVLYEALLFTDKVFLINNESVSQYIYEKLPFKIVSSIQDIAIIDEKEMNKDFKINDIWEHDAILNFKKYFDKIVGQNI